MTDSQMNKADFLTSAVLMAFGIAVMVQSLQMPNLKERGINPYTAPGVVPFFLGTIITLLAIVLLVRSLVRKGWKIDFKGGISGALKNPQTRRLLITLGITLFYAVVLVGWLEYTVSTGLFIFVFILLFEWKGPSGESKTDDQVPSPVSPGGLGSAMKRNRKVLLWAAVEAILASVITAAIFHYLFLVKLP